MSNTNWNNNQQPQQPYQQQPPLQQDPQYAQYPQYVQTSGPENTQVTRQEYPRKLIGSSGILAFIFALGMLIAVPIFAVTTVFGMFLAVFMFFASIILFSGLYIQKPNETRVITFFGKYIGYDDREGLRFTLPWNGKQRVSLRLSNFSTSTSKVNDANGNPIMIAAVVVWQVDDAPRAIFAVDNYINYVTVQSESAVRQVARAFPYDSFEDQSQITLIGDTGQVNEHLQQELQARMTEAGIRIVEARLTDLSYAPEIAEAMLRRQQAAAIVAARAQIVEGAVGMVKDAIVMLEDGSTGQSVTLEPGDRARFATNLMTVITSDSPTSPVVNVNN